MILSVEMQFNTKWCMKYGLLRGGGEQPDFTDLADMFSESNMDVAVMETLCRGFNTLLSKEEL